MGISSPRSDRQSGAQVQMFIHNDESKSQPRCLAADLIPGCPGVFGWSAGRLFKTVHLLKAKKSTNKSVSRTLKAKI